MLAKIIRNSLPLAFPLAVTLSVATALAGNAIYTTDKTGTVVNQNNYATPTEVYLSGGPQNLGSAGLPDGTYYFQVTDPSGKTLLSTDPAMCRQLVVIGGRVDGSAGPGCKHPPGTFDPASGTLPVQLSPFSQTPNAGNVYKAWLIRAAGASVSASNPKVLIFKQSDAKTDNFKVQLIPVGSCQPSSSLSVLVSGTNVISYVPKGAWATPTTGVSVVNVEGSSITPTLIPTGTDVVNSCASNPLSGQTVCTANNNHVLAISGTTLNSTVNSGGSGSILFSGGSCTNCGIAMDATNNRAVIGLSIAGAKGFQFVDLSTTPPSFPALPFASPSKDISEDPLIDPIRNLLLSASENNNYEIVDVLTPATPAFFEHPVSLSGFGELDSSGEDCSTGIALAPAEFTSPSQVFLADLTQAMFTPGSPAGTWTTPATASQVQTLTESSLSAGASGIAVAQGTNTAVISGEFGGDAVTAAALPSTSGSGTPAFSDWVTCRIGSGFSNGLDPHTVTAYQSPSSGDAIALLANGGATTLAVVDLTNMLNTTLVPRTVGGHGCASGTLPAAVVSFVAVP